MSKDQDKFIEEEEYSLEDILAEFAAVPRKEQAGPVFLSPTQEDEEDLPPPPEGE